MSTVIEKIKINDDEFYEIATASNEAGFMPNQYELFRKSESDKMYIEGCGVYDTLAEARAAAAGLAPQADHECDCDECRDED